MAPLCALAPWREMGFLLQSAVLVKAQRRKGRKRESSAMAPLNFQRLLKTKKIETTRTIGGNKEVKQQASHNDHRSGEKFQAPSHAAGFSSSTMGVEKSCSADRAQVSQ